MTSYPIALLVHLTAVLAAFCAAAVEHLAARRRAAATTAAEALEWQRMIARIGRVFPVALLVLVGSGGWMVSSAEAWSWTTGWVDAGLVGVVALFAGGAFMGMRHGRAVREAERAVAGRGSVPPMDHAANALSRVNTGIALAVVCAMTLKLTLGPSLLLLVVGAAGGFVVSQLAGLRGAAAPMRKPLGNA